MHILGQRKEKKREERRSGGEIVHTYKYMCTYSFIRCPYNYVYIGTDFFLFFLLCFFLFSFYLRGQPSIVCLSMSESSI